MSSVTHQMLRASIATAVAAVPLLQCGSPLHCGGGGGQTYDATFVVCDGDAAATADGGTCFATCTEACQALKPSGDVGFGECTDLDAGGAPGTTVTVACQTVQDCTGRRFDGMQAPAVHGPELGAWLARAAWLEASAVQAFRRLARELRAHGAPDQLVAAARSSARDEVRHARLMGALARRHGAVIPRVPGAKAPVRDLEAIALENAVEGCVSETYGAAVAAWQSRESADPGIAATMAAIAPDELEHAALGWAVDAWIASRLDPQARARVEQARTEAARALLDRTEDSPSEHALARALATELWPEAA